MGTFANILRKVDSSGDRFTVTDITMADDQCHSCTHWKYGTLNCAAFPKGIPVGFLMAEFDHTKPYPGDKGLRYSPKK